MSQWIWKFGDFEIYHSLLLHNRRQEYGKPYPVFWKLYVPEPVVRFEKIFTTEGGYFRVHTCGNCLVTIFGKSWSGSMTCGTKEEIYLPPGTAKIQLRVMNPLGLPCALVEGVIETDETWVCDDVTDDFIPVGTWTQLNDPNKTPEEFPFSYENVSWKFKEAAGNGVLFDYGKEMFCRLKVKCDGTEKITIRLGESREEVMDDKWCILRFDRSPENGVIDIEPSAFRYVYSSNSAVDITAEYEYLPAEYRGEFSCEEDIINWVWNTAAYTFHLNTREFFLDGIKRDRWVWGGDAYQSQFVNRYLFMDMETEKRTLVALGGKAPFRQYINDIVDYTYFWFMGIYDYFLTYGDKKFLKQMLPQMEEIMKFCQSRRSEDGLIRGQAGDWVFIDWADIDKEGAVSGEQILFACALESYGNIRKVLGLDWEYYLTDARELRKKIVALFYREELGAFVDSYESGKNHVTRQNNAWAYLYLPCEQTIKDSIYQNVICNDDVRAITTPYFKFFETRVHCEAGNTELLEKCIREYYGPMRDLGATTLLEEFDPAKAGAEHYEMYDAPYGKSMCHAWSASPIYLLGYYRMGVRNTGVAYDTFEVRPVLGSLPSFEGIVPLPQGEVRMKVTKTDVKVIATVSGGKLIVEGREYPLIENEEIFVKI